MSIRLLGILLSVLLINGCGFSPFYFSQSAEFNLEFSKEKEYQYAGPWDTEIYEVSYKRAERIEPLAIKEEIKGGIVPHHLMSGHSIAEFFETIKKDSPSTIVLIGPNHFMRGQSSIITTMLDWKTPYGDIRTDKKITNKLVKDGVLKVDEEVIKEEHSVYSLTSFIARSVPKARVVSIIIKEDAKDDELNRLVDSLKEYSPKDTVFVGSIDFSHYQTPEVAQFHDDLSINVIKSFDYPRINSTEIDSHKTLYTILKLMELGGNQRIVAERHTNSALVVGDKGGKNTTSHYIPYFAKGEPETEKSISLLFFGDMMLDRNVKNRIDKNEGGDYLFRELAGIENRFFTGMDLVHANLEGPFANYRRETTKEIAFRFNPTLLPTLKKYNFDIFTLANNHSLDMGHAGFAEGKKNLEEYGFDYYGEQLKVSEDSLLTKEIAGKKIGFIGLNDTNTPINETKVKALIKDTKEKVDYVIINVHWGAEYIPTSQKRSKYLAHLFVDAGADVIIGHHPHVVQEMEIYKDKPIFYSLGNFVFDQYFSIPTQQSIGVGLILKNEDTSVYVFPFEGEESQIRQMPYEKGEKFMQDFIDKSRLDGYNFNDFSLKINKYEQK